MVSVFAAVPCTSRSRQRSGAWGRSKQRSVPAAPTRSGCRKHGEAEGSTWGSTKPPGTSPPAAVRARGVPTSPWQEMRSAAPTPGGPVRAHPSPCSRIIPSLISLLSCAAPGLAALLSFSQGGSRGVRGSGGPCPAAPRPGCEQVDLWPRPWSGAQGTGEVTGPLWLSYTFLTATSKWPRKPTPPPPPRQKAEVY